MSFKILITKTEILRRRMKLLQQRSVLWWNQFLHSITINVNIVRENCHLTLELLLKSGLHVVAIVCDNHPVNRSFFCQLWDGNPNLPINNPVDPQSKLFLLFDPIHGIKNIYNNFQKAREFRYGAEGIQKPSFQHVRQLYENQERKALRMAHK